jgi:hypothetical protein
MKKYYGFALAFLLPLLSCQNPNGTKPDTNTDQPGYFSLTQLQGLQKSAAATTTASNTIDLGDLHSTTNYYFLLTNTGGHCITNIHLSVSDSSFKIFPTSIDSLTVGLGTQSLVPIIKLTAIHGTGAQGLGSEPLMSPGIHQVHINVTGTTKHNDFDTSTSLTATATVNALVMDIDVHTMDSVINLSVPISFWTLSFDRYNVTIDGFFKSTTDTVITITNKGNVDIRVKAELYDGASILDSLSSCLIGIGDSSKFRCIIPSGNWFIFRLDGNNTVCNPNKLQLQSNGCAYFCFQGL